MSVGAGAAEDNRQLLRAYFAAMAADEDLTRFLTEDVVWLNTDLGERFEGPQGVQAYIRALHTEMFDAHPEGHHLEVTDAHAYLEGAFVADRGDEEVPYCLVYDLDGAGISAMRLYMSFAALEPHRRASRSVSRPGGRSGSR